MIPIFFGANAMVSAAIVWAMRIDHPVYMSLPALFFVVAIATVPAAIRRRLTAGSLGWRLLPAAVYALAIFLASSVGDVRPTGVSGNTFHPFEYAGLAFIAHYGVQGGFAPRPRRGVLAVVVLCCLVYGALDEYHQTFVPGRQVSVIDVGLDAIGVAAGTVVYLGLRAIAERRKGAVTGRESSA